MNLTSIKLMLTGAQAWATVDGPLTSGMVGIPVTIKFDDAWDGLTKNLICRCSTWGSNGGEIRTLLNVGDTSTVAHEVMQPDRYLYLGVEGFSDDGALVIPTTWARCGKIEYGANADGDPSADPELPIWNQLQTQINQINQDGISPEQMDEIRVCSEAATQAANTATDAVKEAAKAAQAAAISAGRAEGAAERAEAAAELETPSQYGLTTAQINALHGMFDVCLFDDSKDVDGAIAAFEEAFGITDSGGGDSGGEDSGGGDTTGDALPTNGLMAYFDLRNLGDKANVTVGTTKGVMATQGSGALYSWASETITSSDDYGAKTSRAMMFSAEGNTTQTDLGTEFTVISFGYGECIGPGIEATNITPRWMLKPKYNNAGGTAYAPIIQASELNADDMTDYNYAVYRVSDAALTIINDTSRKDYNGNDYEGFVSWDSLPQLGRTYYGTGYGTAVAIYNRALSDVEIEEARAFMKTLEVTA